MQVFSLYSEHGRYRRQGYAFADDVRHPWDKYETGGFAQKSAPCSRLSLSSECAITAGNAGYRPPEMERRHSGPWMLLAPARRMSESHDAVQQCGFLEREIFRQRDKGRACSRPPSRLGLENCDCLGMCHRTEGGAGIGRRDRRVRPPRHRSSRVRVTILGTSEQFDIWAPNLDTWIRIPSPDDPTLNTPLLRGAAACSSLNHPRMSSLSNRSMIRRVRSRSA